MRKGKESKNFYYMKLYKNFVKKIENRFSNMDEVEISFDEEDEYLRNNTGLEYRHLTVSLKGGAFNNHMKLWLVKDPYEKGLENRYFTVALKFAIGDIASFMVDFYMDDSMNPHIIIHNIKFYPDILFNNSSYEKGNVSKENIDFVFGKVLTAFENLVKRKNKLLLLLLQDANLLPKGKDLEFLEEIIPIGGYYYKFRFAIDKETTSIFVDGIFSESYKSSINAIEYIANYVNNKFFPNLSFDKLNIYNIVDFFGHWNISKINFTPVEIERGFWKKRKEIVDYNLDFEPLYTLDGEKSITILDNILN